uniref:WD_REPEATS_REGION domain-containing protein n=1 Tax=Globodera pallida TaxID=36090 RepID=A0A183BYV3_GLOPA
MSAVDDPNSGAPVQSQACGQEPISETGIEAKQLLSPFSIPGVLHFLQQEWSRYELERAQWEIERSELKARLSFLIGERKSQENLKHDLVRRIKMLEYALKQERLVFLERAQWEIERSELKARLSFLIGERKSQENLKHDLVRRIKMLEYALKQERAKFQQLMVSNENHDKSSANLEEEDDDDDELKASSINPPSTVPLDIDAILPPPPTQLLASSSSTTASGAGANMPPTSKAGAGGTVPQQTPTPTDHAWAHARETLRQYLQEIGYTEHILEARSFRVKQLLGIQPSTVADAAPKRGADGGTTTAPAAMTETKPMSGAKKALLESEQGVYLDAVLEAAQAIANKSSRTSQRPKIMKNERYKTPRNAEDSDCSSDDQDASGGGIGDVELDAETVNAFSEFAFLKKEPQPKQLQEMREQCIGRKCKTFIGGGGAYSSAAAQRHISVDTVHGIPPATALNTASAAAAELMLLDNNEKYADIKSGFDEDDDDGVQKLRWNIRYTLRSHYDSIRAMQFHPVEPVLITASEDGTAKLWDLSHSSVVGGTGAKNEGGGGAAKTAQSATGIVDIEPLYTFRGHRGPILALDLAPLGETCYTGGLDGKICCWTVPATGGLDIYQTFDPSVLQERLCGHTDAVWCLCFHSASNRLISASADGTIRIWIVGLADGAMPSPLLKTIQGPSPCCNIRDLETGQVVVNFQFDGDDQPGSLNKIVSHPTMPVSIAAGEDRKIRFFDNNTGKLISATMAHVEGVSTLAIDPNGLYLLSGSHDGSLRLWNAEKRVCLQEIAAHRKKLGAGVMAVAFHPSRQLIGSSGADSLAKVYSPIRQSPRSSLISAVSPSSSPGSSGPSSVAGSPQKSSPISSAITSAKQQHSTKI